jgi:hypothetical protein
MRVHKQHNRHKDILFILISSFVVVVAWVGFNIYHVYITSTISEELQMQLTPIDGSFDTTIIQNLKSRERVNPSFEKQTTASQSAPKPLPEPTAEAVSASESSRFAPTDTPINRLGQ